MELNDFIAIGIVGAALSLLVEVVKERFKDGFASRTIVIISSLIIGGLYVWVRSTPYYETVLIVLASASTFYGFFLAKKPSSMV